RDRVEDGGAPGRPRPGAGRSDPRQEDPGRGQAPGVVVDEAPPDEDGDVAAGGRPLLPGQTAVALNDGIEARALGEGSRLAEGGDRAVDQPGGGGAQGSVVEPQPGGHAGAGA